jgi:hypothetical protein
MKISNRHERTVAAPPERIALRIASSHRGFRPRLAGPYRPCSPAAGTPPGHTVEGHAAGKYEAIWRERIEPLHDLILEAMLDNVEAEVASGVDPAGSGVDPAG